MAARVQRPTGQDQAAQLLRDSSGSVLVRGAGTQLDWAGAVADPDLILDTTALTGLISHNPADMTVAVRAGTPLRDLQRDLAVAGQWVALDPSGERDGATVGGLLAAADSGPSRLRYGSLRDLVIGVTLVLADGTVARAGGHVIKNVAGYDLAKLVYGSLGSLSVITEVVLRLHPRPPASVTVAGPADASRAGSAALALSLGPLEPTAVEWLGAPGADRLLVRLDGSPEVVRAGAGRIVDLLAGCGVVAAPLSSTEAATAWRGHADAVLGQPQDTVLRVAGLPTHLADLAARLGALTRDTDVASAMISSAALGLHTLRLRGGTVPSHARVAGAIRSWALRRGSTVLLRRRISGLDGVLDALGPAPDTVGLLRSLKTEFDPAARLAPGRFAPWY